MKVMRMRGSFWSGSTGQAIRGLPNHKETRILAAYLVTGPTADNYGLYPLSLELACLESALTGAELSEALAALAGLDFAHYRSGWVWVVEMAAQQLGAPLKAADYMCKNARRWYAGLPNNPFLGPFWDRYAEDLVLDDGDSVRRQWVERKGSGIMPLTPPSNGAPMPRSVLEDKKDLDLFGSTDPKPRARAKPAKTTTRPELVSWFTEQFWPAYPRHTHRKAAEDAVFKLNPPDDLCEHIVAAVREQVSTIWATAETEKIPHAATWLNGRRWEDEIVPRTIMSKKTAGIAQAVHQFVKGRQE